MVISRSNVSPGFSVNVWLGGLIVQPLGGVSFTLPKTANLNISDLREAKPQPGTLQQLVAGVQVVVKYRTDALGAVKHVKIKIIG